MSCFELYCCMLCVNGEEKPYFSRHPPHVFKSRRCTLMREGMCMYAHELRDCLLPLRSVSGPYDAEFMGKAVVVWIGQKYSPAVRLMVDSSAKDVPY